jgi:hypothetical protein
MPRRPSAANRVALPSSVKLDTPVNLLETTLLLNRHLTDTLCEQVFESVRDKERRREWSLYLLAKFWTAVALVAPPSLGHALAQGRQKEGSLWPAAPTTDEGYFRRCKSLSWKFFHGLFYAFTQKLLAEAQPLFASVLAPLRERFPAVYLIDGSRLDAMARKLKILWDERAVVLPGCLTVIYDLFHGMARQVLFNPDAAASEFQRAIPLLSSLPAGALLVGDRLYANLQLFAELTQRGLWGLFRLNHVVGYERVHLVRRRQAGGRTVIEEWLIRAGSGQTAPIATLRLISFRQGKIRRDLLTNVLDPVKLTAEEALVLYPLRWTIERVFLDLKETLNLHRIYAANPNAVAMQVYGAAMVYNAFRVAQGRIAQQHGLSPEAISPAKCFPKLAEASSQLAAAEWTLLAVRRANKGATFHEPNLLQAPFGRTTLQAILVRKRTGRRRKRRFCASRKQWKSLAHVSGSQQLS